MKKTVAQLQKDPEKIYTLADFETLGLLPWAKNQRTVKKILEVDKKRLNVFKVKIVGEGNQRRYYVKGKNIINYLTTYGPALISTVRKSKNDGARTK